MLVLAGPGSGKTRVLTHRIAYLVATGRVAPAGVLAITFTNRAADELAGRVAELVGDRAAGQMTLGTFHSVCHRMVRPHAPALGRTERFSIYDSDASRKLVEQAIEQGGHQEVEVKDAIEAISLAKARLLSADGYRERNGETLYGRTVGDLYARYERALADSDALDFDDLLVYAVRLLADPKLRHHFQRRWQIALVDEYQDTNPAQYRWLRLLAAQHRNLTVVGDDDQVLYSWRGADLRNVLAFERHFPDAQTLTLGRNYRSTEPIVAAASRLVAHNQERKPKPLRSEVGPGPRVRVRRYGDEQEEAQAASMWCRGLLDKGIEPSEVAVLYRVRNLSGPLEEALLVARVPDRVLGGRGFFDHAEIKDALSHLALVANARDQVAFARAIQAPRRGLGPAAIAKLVGHAAANGVSLVDACVGAEAIEGIGAQQAAAAQAFGLALRNLGDGAVRQTVRATVIECLLASGLTRHLQQQRTAKAGRQLGRLRDFVRAAGAYDKGADQPGLGDFLSHVRLVAGSGDEGAGKVTLATCHGAKGGEWRCVRVIGLEEGVMPHRRSLRERGEEEERRLAYVAYSRACELLVLSSAAAREGRQAAQSRFVAEAGVA